MFCLVSLTGILHVPLFSGMLVNGYQALIIDDNLIIKKNAKELKYSRYSLLTGICKQGDVVAVIVW
jgi:hypothetical protein